MFNANYTADNICRAMGLGGFANDEGLARVDKAIRLLLTPSFHPELCITLIPADDGTVVSTVLAHDQIWHQSWPAPQPVAVLKSQGVTSNAQFERLKQMLIAAVEAPPTAVVICDGMPTHGVLRAHQGKACEISANVGGSTALQAFAAEAIQTAWHSADDAVVRNGLSDAGLYVGLSLPKNDIDAPKPIVRTLVLGDQQETDALLSAMERQLGPKPSC